MVLFSPLIVILLVKSIIAIEYIPVLVWESGSIEPWKSTPALAQIRTEKFKDLVTAKATQKELVLVFAEENLSVEDFSWRDETGVGSFSHLDKVTAEAPLLSRFYSSVESPLDAVLGLGQQWERVPASADLPALLATAKPKSHILVHMDDATNTEDRPDMLQRHDSIIADAVKAAREAFDQVLVIYSGYHTSWVPMENSVRHVRHLLAMEERANETHFINVDDRAFFYSSASLNFTVGNETFQLANLVDSAVEEEEGEDFKMILVYEQDGLNYTLALNFPETAPRYWSLLAATISFGSEVYPMTTDGIYAPFGFSYHCSLDTVFSNTTAKSFLTIKDFQVQPLPPTPARFSDAYDCVWFFTVPIWSGLVVSILLVLILSSGLCMILDIKTMDRFDDPKGKTITITATD